MTKNSEAAGVGHNSGDEPVAQDMIRSVVERVEKLEEEKAEIASDIKDVYAEAKGNGLDPRALRKVVARRKMEREMREEQDALVALYEGVFS